MVKPIDFSGAFTALVTPFRDDRLDLAALDSLVDFQLRGDIHGVVPCGTTGESPTLDRDEFRAVVSAVVARVAGRVPVIAGTGTNSTRETIDRTRYAEQAGADGCMLVMPYYNKPTQGGLLQHVRAVHDATQRPLVLYNIPGRSVVDLHLDTLTEIARACPRVVAVKEATGNVLRSQQIVATLGDRLAVLSGDDALTLGILACGGRGVISVTSNVAPRAVQSVVRRFHEGALAEARRGHMALMPLHDALFVESNPGPVKAALHAMGLLAPELRLPLVWPAPRSVDLVLSAMTTAGVPQVSG